MSGRRFNPEALLPIEVELQREKASALRRVGQRLEQLIAELSRLRAELSSARPGDRARPLARYGELRREAEAQRWKMIVQREALGLTRHDDVDRYYPIPPPIEQ